MNRINQLPTQDLQRIDAAHHLHPFSDMASMNAEGARVIVRADGIWLEDSDGARILDGMSGLWCVNIGYGRHSIAEAVSRQMMELPFYNTFFKTTHIPAVALSEKLAEIAPPGFERVFFCGSGSEANDTIIRMVRHYWSLLDQPDRIHIIARKNGYHGSTVGGASLGGMVAMHEQGSLPIPGIHHIAQPYWFEEGGDMDPKEFGQLRARELETKIDEIGADKVAAFIAEPIQGAGGVIIPPDSYWPEIQRICEQYGILLVADEVICGFGRLGHWFGSQAMDIEPDLMPIAKGLSSGYLPIGGVMVSNRVADVITNGGDFNHGYTYSAHPASCAAALENLRIIEEDNILDHVRQIAAPNLRQKWLALGEHPLVGEARIKGMVGALELVPEKPSRKHFPDVGKVGMICRDISFSNGLIMRAVNDVMIIAPPLVITIDEIETFIRLVEKTLDDTYTKLKVDGWL